MRQIFLFLLLVSPLTCLAQFSVSGKIFDSAGKQPITNASIFLSNTTSGTESGKNGAFSLTNVKTGKYSLIVTVVGYEIFTEEITVNGNLKIDEISLQQSNKQLKEVVIKPDPFRSNYFFMFKEQFLGKSLRAQDCKILNPQVINFDYDDNQKKLTASSNDFIVIENNALGYRIKYLLQDFVYIASPDSNLLRFKGLTVFEPLTGSPAQEKRWTNGRQDAYGNSSIHFFRSILSDDLKGNGFNVQEYAHYNNPDRPSDSVIMLELNYFKLHHKPDSIKYWKKINELPKMRRELMPYSLTPEEIASRTNLPGLYALGCDNNGLFVTYEKKRAFPEFQA